MGIQFVAQNDSTEGYRRACQRWEDGSWWLEKEARATYLGMSIRMEMTRCGLGRGSGWVG